MSPPVALRAGMQQGVLLYSQAITRAVIDALKDVTATLPPHLTAYETKKLVKLGLTPALISYLVSQPTDSIMLRIALARSGSERIKANLTEQRKCRKKSSSEPVTVDPIELLDPKEKMLYDLGDWTVTAPLKLLSTMAASSEEGRIDAKQSVLIELIQAGARASTMYDLTGMGLIAYKNFVARHQIVRPGGLTGGRPKAPSAALTLRIKQAWSKVCEESALEKTNPTLAEKYLSVYKTLSAVDKKLDLATVHSVVQGRVA